MFTNKDTFKISRTGQAQKSTAVQIVALSSSVLSRVVYTAETQTLTVTFTSGRTYRYTGVPVHMFEALRQSPSVGRYFNEYIRGVYACEEIK